MKIITNSTQTISKKEHAPDCTCSICGKDYKGISFKSGYVCESCLEYIKDSYDPVADSNQKST